MGVKTNNGAAGESKSVGQESFLGNGLTLNGTLRFRGNITLHCKFTGEILSGGDLIVSETGIVNANVHVRYVRNSGEITGDIEADEEVQILPGGRVTGNIKTPSLKIDTGAVFSGKSEMPPAPSKPAVTKKRSLKKPVKTRAGEPSKNEIKDPPPGNSGSKKGSSIATYAGVAVAFSLLAFWIYGEQKSSPPAPLKKSSVPQKQINADKVLSPDPTGGAEVKNSIGKGKRSDLEKQEKSRKAKEALNEKRKKEAEKRKREEEEKKRIRKLEIAKKKEVARLLALKKAREAKRAEKRAREKFKKEAEKKKRVAKELKIRKRKEAEQRKLRLAQAAGQGIDKTKPLPVKSKLKSSPPKKTTVTNIRKTDKARIKRVPIPKSVTVKPVTKPEETKFPTSVGSMKKQTIEKYKTILKAAHDNADVNLKLARLYFVSGYEDLAESTFKRQGQIAPDSIEAINNRGFDEFKNKRYEKALNIFKQVILTDTGNYRASFGIVSIYAKQSFYLQAINLAANILKQKPGIAPFQNKLAWLYGKRRMKLDEAISLSLKSLQENPLAADYLSTLATLYYLKGEKGRALTTIEKAIRLWPENKFFKTQLWKFKNT